MKNFNNYKIIQNFRNNPLYWTNNKRKRHHLRPLNKKQIYKRHKFDMFNDIEKS